MVSSVNFTGKFEINKPLTEVHKRYLSAFSSTRRVARNEETVKKLKDSIREAANLPIGPQGEYFVGAIFGSEDLEHKSIISYNIPPNRQPSLWCQWGPSDDGKYIVWDSWVNEHYCYEWIQYLINNFIDPWGYKLNGTSKWIDTIDQSNSGKISIVNNKVEVANFAVFK